MLTISPAVDQGKLLKAYEAESSDLCQKSVPVVCALGSGLILIFAPYDWLRNPDVFSASFGLRLTTAAILAAVFLLVHTRSGRRNARLLGLVCAVATAGMIYGMMLLAGGHRSYYFPGLSMVLLTMVLIIPWRPWWSGWMCSLVVGGYALGTLLTEPLTNASGFLDNVLVLIATSTIAVVTTAIREHLRWREFRTRWTMAEAYRHKSEFFANMSHELRTPIHVIIGYLDMLLDTMTEVSETEGRQILDRLRKESLLLHRLVSDLLDYAKVEAGKMEVHPETFPIEELLAHVMESFRPLAERKGLQLSCECRGDLPAIVSDRQKLQQVLNNVVGNAIKFTESGSVSIEACLVEAPGGREYADLVFLDGSGGSGRRNGGMVDDGVAVAVTDTGLGIRPENLSKLAVDFQQVEDPNAVQYGGTGLGLSLSRKLMSLIGGRIAARSGYGHGSTFILFVPRRLDGASAPSLGESNGQRLHDEAA